MNTSEKKKKKNKNLQPDLYKPKPNVMTNKNDGWTWKPLMKTTLEMRRLIFVRWSREKKKA